MNFNNKKSNEIQIECEDRNQEINIKIVNSKYEFSVFKNVV